MEINVVSMHFKISQQLNILTTEFIENNAVGSIKAINMYILSIDSFTDPKCGIINPELKSV
jgi:hypothetical protein